jgi:hypothetical protein
MPPSLLLICTTAAAFASHCARADPLPRQQITYNSNLSGELTIAYGECDVVSKSQVSHHIGSTHVGGHPFAKRHENWEGNRPTKFVWRSPANTGKGCLHAFVGDEIVGRSKEHQVKRRQMKKRATFADVSDPMGPWFDGVEYLKQKNSNDTFVAATKEKKFGILGGGISGLLTAVSLAIARHVE